MSAVAPAPFVLDRPVAFLAWWKKLTQLDKEYTRILPKHEWYVRGQEVRHLQSVLRHVGRAAGAARLYVDVHEDGSVEFGTELLPSFDWLSGQIDFSAWDDEWVTADPVRGERLIKRIIEVTGISPKSVDDSEFEATFFPHAERG
jgi:hypothetical protein